MVRSYRFYGAPLLLAAALVGGCASEVGSDSENVPGAKAAPADSSTHQTAETNYCVGGSPQPYERGCVPTPSSFAVSGQVVAAPAGGQGATTVPVNTPVTGRANQ